MPQNQTSVIGGVDTHKDAHVASVMDGLGRTLGTASFPADAKGYDRLLAWMESHGPVEAVGVEGTGSYGRAWRAASPPTGHGWWRSTAPTARPAAVGARPTLSTPPPPRGPR